MSYMFRSRAQHGYTCSNKTAYACMQKGVSSWNVLRAALKKGGNEVADRISTDGEL